MVIAIITKMALIPTKEVVHLIHDIKTGKLIGSYNITIRTLAMFKKIINSQNWDNADALLNIVRGQGRILKIALPQECVTVNIARRILKIIREEFDVLGTKGHLHADDSQATLSLHKLVTQTSESEVNIDYTKQQKGLQEALIDHIREIETELETSLENICAQAEEHIHSSEVILTLGYSHSVENFLMRAVKKRKLLTIIIAECAPACRGHNLAAKLATGNVDIIVIPDSAIFAMMSRVNKVIIGTHSVLADGGLRATCGANTVALAAKHYSVPVIVLAPMYKLSPVYLCSYEQNAFNLLGCAGDILPYDSTTSSTTKVYSPVFDYVSAELVTFFISNLGGHAPSYVYRLLTELYHPDDAEI